MKSVLYVGATLMISASIYGFVDYKKSQDKKEFKEMYVEKKHTPPAIIPGEKIKVPVAENETAVAEKKTTGKKAVARENEDPAIAGEASVAEPAKESSSVKKTKKKKKLDARLFSRAPLRDEDLEELPEVPKPEVKKD